MTKLFVGGLPYSVNDQQLLDLFSAHGQVISAKVITDKFTNQSKGFGFVEMEDAEAQNAINALNGSTMEGRTLGVSVARPREDRPAGGRDFRRSDSHGGRGGFDRNRRDRR